jgi:hypothetical protein
MNLIHGDCEANGASQVTAARTGLRLGRPGNRVDSRRHERNQPTQPLQLNEENRSDHQTLQA